MGSDRRATRFLPRPQYLISISRWRGGPYKWVTSWLSCVRTKRAAHLKAGNRDQLQVGLLPVLPNSQGLTWAWEDLTGCLYFSSTGGGGNEWVLGYGIAGGDIFEVSSYLHSPGVSALSPPAQYMHPWMYSHTPTHSLLSGHSCTWFPSSSSHLQSCHLSEGSRITSTVTPKLWGSGRQMGKTLWLGSSSLLLNSFT